MKLTVKILIGTGSIIGLVLIVAAFLPSEYSISRSVIINRPVEEVYAAVIDFREWNNWSPWQEQDPNAKFEFSGEAGTPGAMWSWQGDELGDGKITLVEYQPNKSIKSRLEFTAPREMESDDVWEFEDMGGKTRVTWYNKGELFYPVGRYLGFALDGMIGPDFEKGLDNLKGYVEGEAEKMEKEITEVKRVSEE